MKVLNISQSFEIKGGSDVYFRALSELLRHYGVDVDEFASTVQESKVYPKEINFENPGINDIAKYIYNPEAKVKLLDFISKGSYNLAHLHVYYGKLTASILSPLKERGIPIIQTLHEYKLVCPTYKLYDGSNVCLECKNNKFYKCFIKKCNRNSYFRSGLSVLESYVSLWMGSQDKIDHFITVSDFQKEQIYKMGFRRDNITTVHNFISLDGFPTQYKEGNYVLYFGRIEKEKGIEYLLNAFEKLPSTIKLVIVGDGAYKAEMVQRLQSTPNLKDKVTYAGFKGKEELTETIYNSRFVVVPSIWYETFGLTVIEGMGHFKPVIGARIGGITEIITDGLDGFLVEPENEVQIAQRITQLWEDKGLVKSMGIMARKKVAKQFSPETHYHKLEEVYKRYL